MTTRNEIESLIYLLDDPDEFVRSSVMTRFQELGEKAVPLLDEIQITTQKSGKKKFLQDLIFKLTFPVLEQEFLNVAETGITTYDELESGLLLLSRFHNPTLRTEIYRRKLNRLTSMVAGEINFSLNPVKQMELMIRHVFYVEKFKAVTKEYYHPENSYLSRVLDTRKGIPISLSYVVLLTAHRLELPFSGVNMPVHFLLRFDNDQEIIFIDPFNKGVQITMDECTLFLRRNGIEPSAAMFEPAPPVKILARSMRNLIHSFTKYQDPLRLESMKLLLTHLETLYRKA